MSHFPPIRSPATPIMSAPRTWRPTSSPRPTGTSSSTAALNARSFDRKIGRITRLQDDRRQDHPGEPCPLRSRGRARPATKDDGRQGLRHAWRRPGYRVRGKGQYLYTTDRWAACKVDRVLDDKDEVKLGG